MSRENIYLKFNENQNKLRFALMNYIIDNKKPFNIHQDSLDELNIKMYELFEKDIDVLVKKNGIVMDEDYNINFVYPVSAYKTLHEVTLKRDNKKFYAMCAIDAMGSAFTFLQDVQIKSFCSYCDNKVNIQVKNGQLLNSSLNDLHVLYYKLENISNWATSC